MQNLHSVSTREVSSYPDSIITADPAKFDMEKVYETLIDIVKRVQEGSPVGGDDVCHCSFFPLEEMVHSAVKGELFEDMQGKVSPEKLASRLAFHLFGEVVRIHTAHVIADRRSDD